MEKEVKVTEKDLESADEIEMGEHNEQNDSFDENKQSKDSNGEIAEESAPLPEMSLRKESAMLESLEVNVKQKNMSSKLVQADSIGDFNASNKIMQKVKDLTLKVSQIQRNFTEQGLLYEDPEFPALNTFLFSTDEEMDAVLDTMKNWEWLRPSEIFAKTVFYDTASQYNTELRLGTYSSIKFVNAVATLTHSRQIEQIFVDVDHINMGYVCFQFFKNCEWQYVLIDTRLPFSTELKKFLFSHNGSFDVMWLALLEKAYAKLNGKYQYLSSLSYEDILIDMSCCSLDKIKVSDPDNESIVNSKKLFSTISNYMSSKNPHIVVCMNKNKKAVHAGMPDAGEYGIFENLVHTIINYEDITHKDFKFFRIKNFWGSDSNWSGPFSNNSDEWEKYKSLRDELLNSRKYFNDSYNKYFMKYENFIKEFNTVYIIKIFDPTVYKTYSLKGYWQDKTLAGCPVDLNTKYPINTRFEHNFTQMDSDDSWFNNPQYRVKVSKKTKLHISLIQQDNTASGEERSYTSVDFYVIQNLSGLQRVWEFPADPKIVLHANQDFVKKETTESKQNTKHMSAVDQKQLLLSTQIPDAETLNTTDVKAKRELCRSVVLRPPEGKKYGCYNIVVNLIKLKKKASKVPYFLKVIADNELIIEKLPDTLEQTINGSWDVKTAGGPYYPNPHDLTINPNWTLNPQYLLTFTEPTYVKIVLTKTGKNAKKTKNSRIGLSYTYAAINNKNVSYYENDRIKKPQKFEDKKEETKAKVLDKALGFLKIPFLTRFERKIRVSKEENFKESTYSSSELACIFLKVMPIEGPILLVPSLDQPGVCCDFKITIFSNKEINIETLAEEKNPAVLSGWSQYNAGGSHIYNEEFNSQVEKRTWNTNPLFVLKILDFQNFVPAKHKITLKLSICEPNWKSKLIKTNHEDTLDGAEGKKQTKKNRVNVNSMLCFYILRPSKRVAITEIVYQTAFVPNDFIEYDIQYDAKAFNNSDEIYIMPTTYTSGIEGKFIISAYCDSPVNLQAL